MAGQTRVQLWPNTDPQFSDLQTRLQPYGLGGEVAFWTSRDEPLPTELSGKCHEIDAIADADLLINLRCHTPAAVVKRFRRSALIDIDPGLLQTWVSAG